MEEQENRLEELRKEVNKIAEDTKLMAKNHIDRLLEGRNADDLALRTYQLAEQAKQFAREAKGRRRKLRQQKVALLGMLVVVGVGWYCFWR